MNDCVGIRRILIEVLANEQACFAVRVTAGSDPANIRRKRDIAGHPLPKKMESILVKPHVLSASSDKVAFLRSVVVCHPGFQDMTDVAMPFEKTQG